MPQALIREALDRAEHVEPDVKAAACLHAARVIQRFDPSEALRVLERGIDLVESLPSDVRDMLRFSVASLAATVSPSVAFASIARSTPVDGPIGSPLQSALFNMMSHGHGAEVVAYLSQPVAGQGYPFEAAMNAMGEAADDATRAGILRGAMAAVRDLVTRTEPGQDMLSSRAHSFLFLFTRHWRLLPRDEARAAVRDIASWILAAPDKRMTSGFGSGDDQPRFTSTREQQLYQVLSPLQHLDPEFTRTLLGDYPQLARAAARYPFGMDSMTAELEAKHPEINAPPSTPPSSPLEYDQIFIGHRSMTVKEALATEFQAAFDRARHLYAADIEPETGNSAPIECWPSTSEFRTILFKAGEYEGRAALKYLDRVPSTDLRLLASIELAAALAGLPQVGGMTRSPGGRRRDGEAGPPLVPAAASRWMSRLAARHLAREPLPPQRKPAGAPSTDVHIAPTTKKRGDRPSGGAGSDFWVIEGVALARVLARLYDVPDTRVVMPDTIAPGRFDYRLLLPNDVGQETLTRLMKEGIKKHFGISIVSERRASDAFVLTAPAGITAPSEEEFPHGNLGSGSVTWMDRGWRTLLGRNRDGEGDFDLETIFDLQAALSDAPHDPEAYMRAFMKRVARTRSGGTLTGIRQRMTMGELCELLETSLGRPVVDETHLDGVYVLNVSTHGNTNADFHSALRETLGLVVSEGRRHVPMLVVRPI